MAVANPEDAAMPTLTDPSGAVVGDLAAPRNLSNVLAGVDAVIHSAGLAHGSRSVANGRP
jgi:hypothetical protein